MKKILISSLVGAVIIFMFQALSWMALPIHKDAFRYTDKQAEIMNLLNSSLTETAVYRVPGVPPDATKEQMEAYRNEAMGKPYAMITYHKSFDFSGKFFAIGILLNLVSMFIIAWILSAGSASFNTFGSRFWVSLSIFIFAIFQARLMDANWWSTPMHYLSGELIDMTVMGILTGLWMGWYWGRRK